MKWKLLTSLLILLVLSTSTASAQIIKELPTKTELDNFTASLTSDADYIDNATLQAIAQHPTWPHDVWRDEKGNYYKSFYYSDINSGKGYASVYYDSCGKKLRSVCNIDFELVYAYPGLEVDENNTDPIEDTDPADEGTIEENTTPDGIKDVEIQNNTFENTVNQTECNITIIKSSGNLSSGDNSTGTVNNQGVIDTIKQYIFDFSNTNWSNVSFNFWGN